jgi:hypothetical protein
LLHIGCGAVPIRRYCRELAKPSPGMSTLPPLVLLETLSPLHPRSAPTFLVLSAERRARILRGMRKPCSAQTMSRHSWLVMHAGGASPGAPRLPRDNSGECQRRRQDHLTTLTLCLCDAGECEARPC